eukprot:GHVS01106184.1.p3 GENE.GHVS01106184.1~~GHVS01106184.1.p3  ORF type:complete len:102 (+),score=13.91 GHVS01106184.1:833-1138(+)
MFEKGRKSNSAAVSETGRQSACSQNIRKEPLSAGGLTGSCFIIFLQSGMKEELCCCIGVVLLHWMKEELCCCIGAGGLTGSCFIIFKTRTEFGIGIFSSRN